MKPDNALGFGGFMAEPTVKDIAPVVSEENPLLTFKIRVADE